MKAFPTLLLLFIISISSCKKDDVPEVPEVRRSQAQIRIENATPWVIDECLVDPTNTLSYTPTVNAYQYGQISINQKSAYYTFPLPDVYKYSWVKVSMNNRTYYLLPYDFVGETALAKGFYTYKLTYISAEDRLNLQLVID